MADFYEVRFTVRVPDGVTATPAEAEAWLRFNLRDGCDLPMANPLSNHEPEPVRGTFRVFPTAGVNGPSMRSPDLVGLLPPSAACWCATCNPSVFQMFVCPSCGCKRCPRATSHEAECTGAMVAADTPSGFTHTCSGCVESRTQLDAAVRALAAGAVPSGAHAARPVAEASMPTAHRAVKPHEGEP